MSDEPAPPRRRFRAVAAELRVNLAARLDERVVLGIMGAVVGAASGLVTVGLAWLLEHGEELLRGARGHLLSPVLPALGILAAVVLVKMILRDNAGHGVPAIIESVSRRGGRLKMRMGISRLCGSVLTIIGGGSAGPEAPAAVGGAAVGANLADLFQASDRQRIALVGSGAGAAIAAIFNAPVAGIVFALEVILSEWSPTHIVPVATASVTGTVITHVLAGNQVPFEHRAFLVTGWGLAASVGLAAATTAGSLLFVRMLRWADHGLDRFVRGWVGRAIAGGLIVGAIGIVAPSALGEGYNVVRQAIGETATIGISWVALALLAKTVATAITLDSGGIGGVFAPSLVVGSLLGVLYYRVLMAIGVSPHVIGSEGLYALLGMAGVMSGVLQAPLTAIFLISDITGSYQFIIPLMLVSVATAAFLHRFEEHSVYLRELAERGALLRPRTDARVLTELRLQEVLETDVVRVVPHITLAELVARVGASRMGTIPVENPETGTYLGVVDLDAIRPYLLDPTVSTSVLVEEVMDTNVSPILEGADLREVADRFSQTHRTILPVISRDGNLVGMVDKAKLFELYRRELIVQEQ